MELNMDGREEVGPPIYHTRAKKIMPPIVIDGKYCRDVASPVFIEIPGTGYLVRHESRVPGTRPSLMTGYTKVYKKLN